MKLRSALIASLFLASACVPQRPQPVPEPEPTKAIRVPVPLPPPPPLNWQDRPLSPGAWYYSREAGGSQALYGRASGEAAFIVRCDRTRRQVTLSREGASSGNVMTIRTTSNARNYPVTVQTEPLPYATGTTAITDRFLDDIVFSRGRFSVEVPGMPMLILPTWPEPARVIEDCRG